MRAIVPEKLLGDARNRRVLREAIRWVSPGTLPQLPLVCLELLLLRLFGMCLLTSFNCQTLPWRHFLPAAGLYGCGAMSR
jgi:hypothetical protein